MNPGLSYRESAVAGSSPVRLVILLYEQAIEDLRRAVAAQARGDIEGRTREINHALLVIGHLQATLDEGQGGQVAQNLQRFYEQLRAGLIDAQFRQSVAAVEQQVAHLTIVHDAWCEIERAMTPAPAESENGSERRLRADWRA
jgi:flagellar secretion chaperone FliS